MSKLVKLLALGTGIIGVIVIIWGVIKALIELIKLEILKLKGSSICTKRINLRHHLGSYLLLGLDFLVAADIIRTILHTNLEELAVLGAIVGIRTLLSFFLNLEMKDGHENCTK